MRGDAGAAADQFDAGAFVDVGIPADLAQERGAEQSRHRAADDDGPAFLGRLIPALRGDASEIRVE